VDPAGAQGLRGAKERDGGDASAAARGGRGEGAVGVCDQIPNTFQEQASSAEHERATWRAQLTYAFAFGGKPKTPGGTQDVDQHLKQTMRALVKTRPRQADVTLEALYYTPRSPTKSKKISVKVEKPTFFTSVHKEVLFDDYEVKTQKCAM